MSDLVIETTVEEMTALRVEILNELGMTLDAFREKVRSQPLNGDEWDALYDLNSIAFLLGEPTLSR